MDRKTEERNREIEIELQKSRVEQERKDRIDRARENGREWQQRRIERKDREQVVKQIIVEIISTTVDSKVEKRTKEIQTTARTTIENREEKKIEKRKVSPGILKIKRMFEPEATKETESEQDKGGRVKVIRNTFEQMMDRTSREGIERKEREVIEKRRERK